MKSIIIVALAAAALGPFVTNASATELYDRLNGPGRATGTGGYDPSNDWDYYQRHDSARPVEGRSSGYGWVSPHWRND